MQKPEMLATPPGKSLGVVSARKRANLESLNILPPKKPSEKQSEVVAKLFRPLNSCECIEDYYTIGELIAGSGGLSKINKAKRKSDGLEVVLKQRKKEGGDRGWRQMMTELSGMTTNKHILKISEILEDDKMYYIAMPPCDGGELFELLMTADEIPERECKRIAREILVAVGHLHENDIIHRDIKPENILFDSDKTDPMSPKTLKLIDFDTVSSWTPASPTTKKFVGTPGYIAPEAFIGEATPQSDLWSVGVILYILMTGDSPWSCVATLEDGTVGSPKAVNAYRQLKAETPDFDGPPWPDFPLARDLCEKLLAFEQSDRPSSVQEALAHPWLVE